MYGQDIPPAQNVRQGANLEKPRYENRFVYEGAFMKEKVVYLRQNARYSASCAFDNKVRRVFFVRFGVVVEQLAKHRPAVTLDERRFDLSRRLRDCPRYR